MILTDRPFNRPARDRMSDLRERLIKEHPFFGNLALKLALEEMPTRTMETNGTLLRYSPAFLETLTDPQAMYVLAEEVMHCALGHPWRLGDRDPHLCNLAGDEVIRRQLAKVPGLECPPSINWTPDPECTDDMTMEQVYSLFYGRASKQPPQEQAPQQQQQQQQGNGQPGEGPGEQGEDPNGQPGGFTAPDPDTDDDDADDDAQGKPGQDQTGQDQTGNGQDKPRKPKPLSETDWLISGEEAAMYARKAGTMPGGLSRTLKDARDNQADWTTLLRDFFDANTPAGTSWATPDNRNLWRGIYLPGPCEEGTANIDVAIDASGSITAPMLNTLAPELRNIFDTVRPARLRVIWFDDGIRRVDEYTLDEANELRLEIQAGGGTTGQPVTDLVNEDPPACLVWFTDLDFYDSPKEPDCPVLWLTPEHTWKAPPFNAPVVRLRVS